MGRIRNSRNRLHRLIATSEILFYILYENDSKELVCDLCMFPEKGNQILCGLQVHKIDLFEHVGLQFLLISKISLVFDSFLAHDDAVADYLAGLSFGLLDDS